MPQRRSARNVFRVLSWLGAFTIVLMLSGGCGSSGSGRDDVTTAGEMWTILAADGHTDDSVSARVLRSLRGKVIEVSGHAYQPPGNPRPPLVNVEVDGYALWVNRVDGVTEHAVLCMFPRSAEKQLAALAPDARVSIRGVFSTVEQSRWDMPVSGLPVYVPVVVGCRFVER